MSTSSTEPRGANPTMPAAAAETPTDDWPIGCQARPWLQTLSPDDFTAQLAEITGAIAAAGYAGFETALARLPLDDADGSEDLRQLLRAAGGLRLCGAHAGGRWWADDVTDDVTALISQAELLPAVGCDRLVVSLQAPPEHPDDDQLAAIVANLTRLGHACRSEYGVHLGFHNHAAELRDDARILSAIVDGCDPDDVQLAADLGWVAVAGMDVVEFIQRFGSRLGYLHVRDVTKDDAFVEVGRVVLDHQGIFDALRNQSYAGWLVVESEFSATWAGESTPEATVTAQFEGLHAQLTA